MTKTLYDSLVKEEGVKEGIKEGEHKKALKIAKKLLEKGQDIDTVMDATELTEEEIKRLIKEI